MSDDKQTWYGIAMSVSKEKWVMNVMIYNNKGEAERHAANIREKNFVPEYIEVVELTLPKRNDKK